MPCHSRAVEDLRHRDRRLPGQPHRPLLDEEAIARADRTEVRRQPPHEDQDEGGQAPSAVTACAAPMSTMSTDAAVVDLSTMTLNASVGPSVTQSGLHSPAKAVGLRRGIRVGPSPRSSDAGWSPITVKIRSTPGNDENVEFASSVATLNRHRDTAPAAISAVVPAPLAHGVVGDPLAR